MEAERRSLQIGTAVVAGALLLRLLSGGMLDTVAKALSKPEIASFLLYLETGRVIRPVSPQESPEPIPEGIEDTPEIEPQPEMPPQPEVTEPVTFSPGDAATVKIRNYCGYETDVSAMLEKPLSWNLKQDAPTVLILHSHGSESYEKTEDYEESSAYRTLDNRYNMVSIGARVAEILESAGIQTVHDVTVHDYPSYNGSYDHAREAIQEYLSQNPEICLVLDLHRDAAENENGEQFRSTVSTPQGDAAQLMLVVGTDAGGLNHPQWEENMSLAVKVCAQLEKNVPGICRDISFRSQRFNQDLSTGGLLVEVGAAGNTRQEALLAAELLADVIIQLAGGSITDSTS